MSPYIYSHRKKAKQVSYNNKSKLKNTQENPKPHWDIINNLGQDKKSQISFTRPTNC